MKTLSSKRQPNQGFALIATILLMVLLAIITVGTLSLSVVTLRTGNQDSAQARARANARMALMIAIGELQKQMGADQRISAKSDILDPDSSEITHRHWIGSWNSWKAGDSESSQHRTIQGVADDMAPTYLPNRNDHFRKWLVSLTDIEASSISTPRSLNLQASSLPGDNDDAIYLVAEGSLGETSGNPEDFVAARLLDIKDMATSQITGRYGWWVGDESQKARIMADSYAAEESELTSAEKIYRNQAPASMGNTSVRGLKDIQRDRDLGRIPSLATLDLVEGAVDRPAQTNFHDVTPFSFSVLSDVREGGLKRDLSTLLERTVDPDERTDEFMLYKFNVKDAWANDTVKYPTLPVTPQECVPIQDLAAFYQLYDQSRKGGVKYTSTALPNSIQLSNPDYGNATTYTTQFQREYTALYRNPVVIKVQFLLSIRAEPITAADRAGMWNTFMVNRYIPLTDTHKLRFAVVPAVTMWNPYNVPIVMESGPNRVRQLMVKSPPLMFDIRKRRADGTTYPHGVISLNGIVTGVGNRSEIVKLNIPGVSAPNNSPIVFQPGEVRVFSAVTSSPYFLAENQMYHAAQNMNRGKNMVDAAPGWNPNGILSMRHSCNGYQIGNNHNTLHPINPNPAALPGPTHPTVNIFYEPAGTGRSERWSCTMNANSTDAFEITPYTETPTYPAAWPPSEGTSPDGAALCFYTAQRYFSAGGNTASQGFGYLNVRDMSFVSRFGGGSMATSRAINISRLPRAFNEQIIKQGSTAIKFGTAMEPVTAMNIVAASNAGETHPFLQLAIMAGCETSEMANGGLVSGRKFASRPFLHSSPFQSTVIDKVDGTAHYNHGWNWWIDEMNSVLESMVQESQSGNGFYGGGYSTESGVTHVVQQEIPVTPPISIASLSHARLGGFTLANEVPVAHGYTGQQMENLDGNMSNLDDPSNNLGFQRVTATGQGGLYPHALQSIGNSYANPNLAPGVAYNPAWKRLIDEDDGERDVVFADHSYLANKALWDDYFFSSITPQPGTVEIFGSSNRTALQVANDFFLNGQNLPNRRMIPYSNKLDPTKLNALFATKDAYTNGLGDKIAGHLMVKGPFNVNSTSVEAWKVLFSSLKGKPIAYLDGGKAPKEAATGTTAPIGMGALPIGLPSDTADTEDPRDPQQWKGLRVITDDEIDALAQAMVREVKKRGPFLSLSEFVNRRLDSNNTDGMALKGALQAALDYDGKDANGNDEPYPEVTINKNFRSDARKLDDELDSIAFPFQKAAEGPAAYGSSAYVDQADVLRQFAEQLTPRGDTFVIRTYGDALDKNGKVIARAWCEAVVQRTPDYVDSADENHVRFSQLNSDANRRFGRNFQIYSFRWLNSSEI